MLYAWPHLDCGAQALCQVSIGQLHEALHAQVGVVQGLAPAAKVDAIRGAQQLQWAGRPGWEAAMCD